MDDVIRANTQLDTDDDPPISAIFIDKPNVEQGAMRLNDDVRYSLNFNWMALSDHMMQHELLGTTVQHAGIYIPARGSANQVTRAMAKFFSEVVPAGFDPTVRLGKDIDAWLINDIRNSIDNHLAQEMKKGKICVPLKFRHILVSGDGGYLRPYRDLKKAFGDNLEIDLVVYSIRDCIHHELRQFASRVYYLDDLQGVISFRLSRH